MGQFNSSEWRVKPVFDALIARDKTGLSWLPTLLSLPRREGRPPVALSAGTLGPLEEFAWSSPRSATNAAPLKEKALPAPQELLEWLILHVDPNKTKPIGTPSETKHKRELLGKKDQATQAKAQELVSKGNRGRSWQNLEGASYPDAYLRTNHAVVVIEGKFTERAPTTRSTWMDVRHQMLRHIDAAWDTRAHRSVYGFFIVEDTSAPGWTNAVKQTIAREALQKSLPHRSPAVQASIAEAFLGITTWEEVRHATGLRSDLLKPLPA